MESSSKKLCIFGTGGFGRETLLVYIDSLKAVGKDYRDTVVFMVSDQNFTQAKVMGVPVIRQSEFDVSQYRVVIAIGEPKTRKSVVAQLPQETEYTSLIHPTAVVSEWVDIGVGSIITAGVIVTCNIVLGKHTQLNLHTTIGHDCSIGDYFTTAPGAKISGICEFGQCVYFGTSAAVRQGVSICDDVTIGMGGVVVKNIDDPGVYIGNPLKKLEKRT